MMPMVKLLPLAAALPLAFAGCTSTNPKAAFDDVGKHVASRPGQEVPRARRGSPQSNARRHLLHRRDRTRSLQAPNGRGCGFAR